MVSQKKNVSLQHISPINKAPMIKKSFLLSVLYISFVLLGPRDGICQTTYTPDQWQTTLASTEDDYADICGDSVITRVWGHSITVSCVRDTDQRQSIL